MNQQQGPLEEPAREWFVNRKRELDAFWKWASGIPHPGRNSYVLFGLRRTGKTALMHRTFNRLFNEQDRILPVYISFGQYLNQPKPITAHQFVREYFTGYIRSYLAFYYRQPQLHQQKIELEELRAFAATISDDIVAKLFHIYEMEPVDKRTTAHGRMQWVINFPKGYAWTNNMPTAMFVDEFQVLTRVLDPDDGHVRNLTDSFQHAVETRYAPMLVSGSSVSMMIGEAVSGLLSGRFKFKHLGPLSQEHAVEMVFRLGQHKGIPVTEELAAAVWEWTRGYPYSIECIFNSDSPLVEHLPDLDVLEDIIFFELTDHEGALGRHYESQYGKYVCQLNGNSITRKILYWITNYPGEHLHAGRIAKVLGLDVLDVQTALDKLYELDILDHAGGGTFWGPTDLLLLDYLKYIHYLSVEDFQSQDAEAKLRRLLNQKQGEMNRQAGYFSEIIVGGVLNNFDLRTVDGATYFGIAGSVTLPYMSQIHQRKGVIDQGQIHEIDVIGEYRFDNGAEGNAALGAWLVSVRYRKEKMRDKEVDAFIKNVAAFQSEKQYGQITRWYFSKAGFTKTASQKLKAEGIYFSDLAQFNALADLFGLLPLSM